MHTTHATNYYIIERAYSRNKNKRYLTIGLCEREGQYVNIKKHMSYNKPPSVSRIYETKLYAVHVL